jgi:hypothetical protein
VRNRIVPVALLLLASTAFPQEWEKEEKTDQLRGTHFFQFSLKGKYLTPPGNTDTDSVPLMVVRCALERSRMAKFLEGYIDFGKRRGASMIGSERVEYRLDDGRLQLRDWAYSTDFAGLFFPYFEFCNLLFGHQLPHKPDTNPQVAKIVIGVQEQGAGEVVMQFMMPDATAVGDACGVIVNKKAP